MIARPMRCRSDVRAAGLVFLVLACTTEPDPPPDPPEPGSLLVTVATTGATLDTDGYTVDVAGGVPGIVGVNGSVEIPGLSAGEHELALTGVAGNCQVGPTHPRTVVIAPAEQAAVNLSVRCDSLLRNAIVFSRIHDGTSTIYWISPAGSPPTPIIAGASPAVSPDGARIAFDRPGPGTIAIWTAKVDGTSATRLTVEGQVNQLPRWSPDGRHIAFGSNRDGNHEIYVMKADGSEQRRLTTNPEQDDGPHWSPDGTRLAFTRGPDSESGNVEVFLMNADGSGIVNVTNHPESDNMLDWAPDGSRLLINSTRGESQLSNEVFSIDLDGSNALNLSNHEAFEGDAAWSPAGDAIVFASSRDGDMISLYRADADGQNVVRLTTPTSTQVDYSSHWVP